ncbi:MAG TPA: NAD(P)/FAD-dependent oxidoreductase [Xanthobacteraceae bacterium]|nr:NAD(P)/FAD-dependent oxidoreductase [Xanthobacteraceae bacterium]
MAETTSVVVIGAGPAGLAVGACLRKAGIDFTILERANEIAPSWRRHYERLHLHTIKRFSALPLMPFPKDYPRYVPRRQMVEYLASYARTFNLQPRLGQTVRSVRKDGDEWLVESTSASIRAPNIVVASGYNAEPVQPVFPGADRFKGRVMDAKDYVNGKPFAGQSVLVVGMGNTGAEIALDLAEQGAYPTISVRSGVHIVPRQLFGIPIQLFSILSGILPLGGNSPLLLRIIDRALGDLAPYGIHRPPGPIMQKAVGRARIPVIDVGTVKKIQQRAIKVAPGITGITADGAVFADGSSARFDTIIFATGYRANYSSFLDGYEDDGAIGDQAVNDVSRSSGVYFVGLRNSASGLLRDIAREAAMVADDIAQRQRRAAHH